MAMPIQKLRRFVYLVFALALVLPNTASILTADDVPARKDEQPAKFKAPLYGKIIDEDGKPVTDAKLSLQGPGYYRTETDDEGRYEFLDADKPGEYRLEIKSQGWVGITDYQKRPRVFVVADKSTEKNFTLKRACQIEIQVVDDAGEPLKGLGLYYGSVAGRRSSRTDKTDADGKVTVGGLVPAGRYAVGSINKGYVIKHTVVAASADVDQVVKQKLVLKEGVTVTGKAICSDGQPPTGWRIGALPSDWQFGVSPGGAVIGKDGSFELPNVGTGDYTVSISIPSGDSTSFSRPVLTGANLAEMKQPIQVKLDYPSPGSMNYITGKIRWIGKPLDKRFSISGYSYEGRHHTRRSFEAGTTEFKVGPTPPGTYRIRADHPELECINLRKIKNLDDLDAVKVPNDKPLQIVLRVRGRPALLGAVIDAETKKPVKDFRFRVTKLRTLSGPNYVEDGRWQHVRDNNGQLSADVNGPGIYMLSVIANGYAINSSEPINTDESEGSAVQIPLQRGVSFGGQVVDADGKPVVGATVMALSMAAGTMPRVMETFVNTEGSEQTDQNGSFTFQHLRGGRDSFRVTHPDYVFAEHHAIKIATDAEPLKVTLTTGATIRGRVFDASGKPEPNVALNFQNNYAYGGSGDEEAGRFGQTTTDSEGRYEIHHIPEQLCYVSRGDPWNSNGVVRHALLPEDGKVHELSFGGTSRLTGEIRVNGQPLAETRVQLGGRDSTFGAMKMFANTDAQGRFTLFGAPPGHWTLYRAMAGQRSEWTKVRELDAPAGKDLELGVIEQQESLLTVRCPTKHVPSPKKVRVQLQRYDPVYSFGRQAGKAVPRQSDDAPFQFEGVTPGEYDLVAYGVGNYGVREFIKVTNENLGLPFDFHLPVGTAKATIKAADENGTPSLNSPFTLVSDDGLIHFFNTPSMDGPDAGVFKYIDMPPARYQVRLGRYRGGDVIKSFVLKDGEAKELDVVIKSQQASPKGYVKITVCDDQGVIVPCKIGIADDSVTQRPSNTYTSLVGRLGSIAIEIEHPGFQRIERTVELKPSTTDQATHDVRLSLRRDDE